MAIPDDYQNEMMVLAFAATLMATIPILLGNEFDVNVGLKKKKVVNLKKWNNTLPAIRKTFNILQRKRRALLEDNRMVESADGHGVADLLEKLITHLSGLEWGLAPSRDTQSALSLPPQKQGGHHPSQA